MYTIDEFSKITGLSIETLRFYHEQGLLVPSAIDDQTGCRYYAPHLAERARVIARLRGLEFSLTDIAEMLAKHDDESDILACLEGHRRAIEGYSAEPPGAPLLDRPPQFSLRALLGLVAVAAVICFLATVVSALWAVIIGWFVLLVIGHVLGNWLGRTIGRKPVTPEQTAERPSSDQPLVFAPPSRLWHRAILGRAPFVSAGLSAVLGSVLGIAFVLNRPEPPSWTGLVVGALSAAVIGGLLGFLVSSFLTVGLRALHEACGGSEEKPHQDD
jgi:DNA-binding transcriptional MerR regulator